MLPAYTLQSNHVAHVFYECRDIGYGIESGSFEGYWTGEIDTWGKFTCRVVERYPDDDFDYGTSGDTLYLFPDEIVEVEAL